MAKRILVVGSGGREHALAWKIAQSPRLERLYVAPGNAGTKVDFENVPIAANDVDNLLHFAERERIDMAIIGPDDPLALGIVDRFQRRGIKTFGPTQNAAQIESSKAFAKEIMNQENIPTAQFKVFIDYDTAMAYVQKQGAPIVIKASGLALGKGVTVARTIEEADLALQDIFLRNIFGKAGEEVVIEEFLEGPEISIHAFCDGTHFSLLPTAQDHKTIFENDEGPNTGGMGTIAPLPWVTAEQLEEIGRTIITPLLSGLARRDMPFTGLLYPGLIMTKQGPKVLEFNARFGDPEAQSYMRLLKTDLLEIVEACIDGVLDKINIEWYDAYVARVVLASNGYPGPYEKGQKIKGIKSANGVPGVVVFHAGTMMRQMVDYGTDCVTNGGRVLGVTGVGRSLRGALEVAYEGVDHIKFKGKYYRRDIGRKALNM